MITEPYEWVAKTHFCPVGRCSCRICFISAHISARPKAEWVILKETGMISMAMMPTCSSGSTDSRPAGEFSSLRKFVYGYSPIPMPWMNTTGSFVFEVCGRCQYVVCFAGDRYFVKRVCGRNGKRVKKRDNFVRWK